LPVSFYNVPLTIRSTVPPSWAQVMVEQGNSTQIITSVIEGNERVIYYNALPNGGDVVLAFPNPVPGLTSLNPTSVSPGSPAFTLTVIGNNFVNGSVIRWNNSDRATTYISATQLTATIPASDIASNRPVNVSVFNPSPGGGLSNSLLFAVGTKPITVTDNPRPMVVLTQSLPIRLLILQRLSQVRWVARSVKVSVLIPSIRVP
jgi:hypothetical protein